MTAEIHIAFRVGDAEALCGERMGTEPQSLRGRGTCQPCNQERRLLRGDVQYPQGVEEARR